MSPLPPLTEDLLRTLHAMGREQLLDWISEQYTAPSHQVVPVAWLAALEAAQPMLHEILTIFEPGSRDVHPARAQAILAALLPSREPTP